MDPEKLDEILGLIDAVGALVPRVVGLVQGATATWNETDKSKVDTALAALQAQSDADYQAARSALQAAAQRG